MSTEQKPFSGTLEYQKSRAAKAVQDLNDFTEVTFKPGDDHFFDITDWGLNLYVMRGYALLFDKDDKPSKTATTIVSAAMSDAKKVIAKVGELQCMSSSPLSDWKTCIEKVLQSLYPTSLFIELAPPQFDRDKATLTICYEDIGSTV